MFNIAELFTINYGRPVIGFDVVFWRVSGLFRFDCDSFETRIGPVYVIMGLCRFYNELSEASL